MKNFLHLLASLLTLATLLASAPSFAQLPAFELALPCASGQGSFSSWGPQKIATDSQGNVYVAGTFSGTVALGNFILTATSFNPYVSELVGTFLAKVDVAGNYVWATQVTNEYLSGLAVDGAGNVYVSGYFLRFSVGFGNSGIALFNSSSGADGYVAKLNGLTGQWLWARRCGGVGDDDVQALTVSVSGDVYITGGLGSRVGDFGTFTLTATQYNECFLAKLDTGGGWLWAQPIATAGVAVNQLVVDGQGFLYATGVFGSFSGNFNTPSVTFGTTTLSTQRVAGSGNPDVGHDVFVAKFNTAGGNVWAVQGAFNGQNLAEGVGLAADGLGHLFITGIYTNTSVVLGSIVLPNVSVMAPQFPFPAPPLTNNYYRDAYVARLDAATGTWQWATRVGGAQADALGAIAADRQGNVYVAGRYNNQVGGPYFENPLPAGGRVPLAQLNADTGTWRWALPIDSTEVSAIALDPTGRVIIAGKYNKVRVAFGAFTLHRDGPGRGTGYVARLAAGPLARQPKALGIKQLAVWPNPSGRGTVQVQGPAPGQPVQLLDALGRVVANGRMPANGLLSLAVPNALPAGLYLVRSAGQACRLVVE